MSTYTNLFDKHDKMMADTLVAIQGGQKGDLVRVSFKYDTYDTHP